MAELKARDVMKRPVTSARTNASARDIALQLLSGLYSGMPVVDDEGNVVGVVTEFDLIGQIFEGRKLEKLTAEEVMQKDPIVVDVNTPLKEVMKTMLENFIIRVPVVENGKLVGIIARCDILKAYLEPEFVTIM